MISVTVCFCLLFFVVVKKSLSHHAAGCKWNPNMNQTNTCAIRKCQCVSNFGSCKQAASVCKRRAVTSDKSKTANCHCPAALHEAIVASVSSRIGGASAQKEQRIYTLL